MLFVSGRANPRTIHQVPDELLINSRPPEEFDRTVRRHGCVEQVQLDFTGRDAMKGQRVDAGRAPAIGERQADAVVEREQEPGVVGARGGVGVERTMAEGFLDCSTCAGSWSLIIECGRSFHQRKMACAMA